MKALEKDVARTQKNHRRTIIYSALGIVAVVGLLYSVAVAAALESL